MKLITTAIFVISCNLLLAQQPEDAAVKNTINTFFKGMKNNDTALINTTVDTTAFLYSISSDKGGSTKLDNEKMSDFLKQVASLKGQNLDERLQSYNINIDGAMAIAWTPYKFFFNDKLSHCGVNVFTMIKRSSGWKILGIVDTRRREGCE